MTAKEIIDKLNETDEITEIEAKTGSAISNSTLETICAYSNEPNIGIGYLLLGVKMDSDSLFPQYTVEGIDNVDQLQSDLATQCATLFNIPIRPQISIEQINDKNVAVITVTELPEKQKPVYFKKIGLPNGAYRRIGPTDHKCTEDDMNIFYANIDTDDQVLLKESSLADIDENAISLYKKLRSNINPNAEELNYDDNELLESLGCKAVGSQNLYVAGLLLFGKSSSLRRVYPMMRVDYIRVPGNRWVEDPDNRFVTIDMRGSLMLLSYRIVDAIYSDLPKGFKLENVDLQATHTGFPIKALREAVINSLMHRSYRSHTPIQVIRYDNRLEIVNPGFSLKSEDQLGKPGSKNRNPFIAAVFHETNLAETKGSGIRAMKALLKKEGLAPPTFESDRNHNSFTARLLLVHFLNKEDLEWLKSFTQYDLSDAQKQAVIFVREVGAINIETYRQFADMDSYNASTELRYMRSINLIELKGKGRGTYYVPGRLMLEAGNNSPVNLKTLKNQLITEAKSIITDGKPLITDGKSLNTDVNYPNNLEVIVEPSENVKEELLKNLPEHIRIRIKDLKKREKDIEKVKEIINDICYNQASSLREIALLLERDENYVSRTYVKPMMLENKIELTIPEMPQHPNQKYKSTEQS